MPQGIKSRNFEPMGTSRNLGTRLAPFWGMARLCAVLAMTTTMGCLVTEEGDFPVEENLPPFITSQPGAEFPLDRVHVLALDGGGGMALNIPLDVIITDLNVDQTLQGLVLVDNLPPEILDPIAPAPDDSPERDVTVTFDTAQLQSSGCHRVELRVSSAFGFFSIEPELEGDLGTAVWWFFSKDDPTNTFDPASCPGPRQ